MAWRHPAGSNELVGCLFFVGVYLVDYEIVYVVVSNSSNCKCMGVLL